MIKKSGRVETAPLVSSLTIAYLNTNYYSFPNAIYSFVSASI